MTTANEEPYKNNVDQPEGPHVPDTATELTTIKKLDAGKALMLLEKDNTRLIAQILYRVKRAVLWGDPDKSKTIN